MSCVILLIIVSPYNPDGHFSSRSLSRLEAAGIPVVSQLTSKLEEFASLPQVSIYMEAEGEGSSKTVCLDVIEKWMKKMPTWRELFDVLRQLELGELGQQMDDYLNSEQGLLILKQGSPQKSPTPNNLSLFDHSAVPPTVPLTRQPSLTSLLNLHKLATVYWG